MTSVVTSFPKIEISGKPFERGVLYGQMARELIGKSASLYGGQLTRLGFSSMEIDELVKAFLPKIEDFGAGMIEEMKGIAKGAELPFAEIALINMRTELLQLARKRKAAMLTEDPDGCTGLIAFGAATSDGELVHAQNWDWRMECVETSLVMLVRRDDGPDVLTFTEAGGLARNGMNSVGTSLTANYLESNLDHSDIGVPLPLIRRAALEEADFAMSLKLLSETRKSGSNNLMVSHAAGFGIDLECAPDEAFAIYPEDDIVVHANRWISPIALGKLKDTGSSPSSFYRGWRVDRILRQHHGQIDIGVVKAALADRFGWPHAVCRPPLDNDSTNLSATVATVIMKPGEGWMEIAPLPALGNGFTRYQISMENSVRKAAAE